MVLRRIFFLVVAFTVCVHCVLVRHFRPEYRTNSFFSAMANGSKESPSRTAKKGAVAERGVSAIGWRLRRVPPVGRQAQTRPRARRPERPLPFVSPRAPFDPPQADRTNPLQGADALPRSLQGAPAVTRIPPNHNPVYTGITDYSVLLGKYKAFREQTLHSESHHFDYGINDYLARKHVADEKRARGGRGDLERDGDELNKNMGLIKERKSCDRPPEKGRASSSWK